MCLTKSGESGKDCKGVAAQKQFCISFVQNLGASGIAVGKVCTLMGWTSENEACSSIFGLSALVELQSSECPVEC